MRKQTLGLSVLAAVVLICGAGVPAESGSKPVQLVEYEDQFSFVSLIPTKMGEKAGIAVVFEGSDDLHYYAKKETAAGGYNLKIAASAKGVTFAKPVFPEWTTFRDPVLEKNVEVYIGDFAVFIPIESYETDAPESDVEVTIDALVCTSKICLMPFTKTLTAKVDFSGADSWKEIDLVAISKKQKDSLHPAASYSAPVAFLLALVAGVILNVMPCVWPIIPIIVMRLWNQAGKNRAKSLGFGVAFSTGILLFFAAIAVFNIILIVSRGTVFQWGDPLRSPAFVASMSLLMIALGLFMFDLFTIGIPASVSGGAGSGTGVFSTVGMGFLAAILATPCSGAILAAAVAWAQTQTIAIASFTIMLIGVGMALPYLILTSIPSLIDKLPKEEPYLEIASSFQVECYLRRSAAHDAAALPEKAIADGFRARELGARVDAQQIIEAATAHLMRKIGDVIDSQPGQAAALIADAGTALQGEAFASTRDMLTQSLIATEWGNRFTGNAKLAQAWEQHIGTINRPGMVRLAGGLFPLGEEHKGLASLTPSSAPQHVLTLTEFAIDTHEVTNKEFQKFVDAGGYQNDAYWPEAAGIDREKTLADATGRPGPRYWREGRFIKGEAKRPVVGVSWYEAAAYAAWAGKSLPTEAQWECTAVGIPPENIADCFKKRTYPWGEHCTPKSANLSEARRNSSTNVSEVFQDKSPAGCYHMIGNVREWTRSLYDPYPNSACKDKEFGQGLIVVRGASYKDSIISAQATRRRGRKKNTRDAVTGFRCAWSPYAEPKIEN